MRLSITAPRRTHIFYFRKYGTDSMNIKKKEGLIIALSLAALAAVVIAAVIVNALRPSKTKNPPVQGSTSSVISTAPDPSTGSPADTSSDPTGTSGIAENTSSPDETSLTADRSDTADSPETSSAPVSAPPETSALTLTETEAETTRAPVEITTKQETTSPAPPTAASRSFVFVSSGGSLTLLEHKGNLTDGLYPASLTKLVTAMTVLDFAGNRLSDVVTVKSDVLSLVSAGSSLAELKPGMKLTLEQTVSCMLIPSGNDAAYVAADYVGGLIDPSAKTAKARVSAFVAEMNRWSTANALINSHWTNPDGFHASGHYTCMNDLMIIVQQAIQIPLIRSSASTSKTQMKLVSGETIELASTNLLLDKESKYYNSYCIGIKTGYTSIAGNCIISCFQKDEKLYFIGTFGDKDPEYRFRQSAALFEKYSK